MTAMGEERVAGPGRELASTTAGPTPRHIPAGSQSGSSQPRWLWMCYWRRCPIRCPRCSSVASPCSGSRLSLEMPRGRRGDAIGSRPPRYHLAASRVALDARLRRRGAGDVRGGLASCRAV